jgi:undecaprenyl diphosphate synthase
MNEKEHNIKHITILCDGNRRWAKEHGLPTLEGHRKGADNVETLIRAAREKGIGFLTFWLWSTENWTRTKDETGYIMDLGRGFFAKLKKSFIKNEIRFIHLGRKDRFEKDISDMIIDLENATKNFTKQTVALALDYGGHDEIIRAVNKINEAKLPVTVENIEANLDTSEMPMPDLIIRTGGEQRLSGFMAWQMEYAEFYFSKLYFPDFNEKELQKAIDDFHLRDRRFGGDSKTNK